MLESAILEGGLKGKALGLEKINTQIENEKDCKEKEKMFIKAENIEKELGRIEGMMGINSREALAIYNSITPDDARDVVLKTFQKLPEGLIEQSLLTIDNLKKIGGKIMCWASMRSPIDAPIIVASIMILLSGPINEAAAGGFASMKAKELLGTTKVEPEMAKNVEPDPLENLEIGGNFMDEGDGGNPFYPTQELPNGDSNIIVNGEPARVIENNERETTWGGRNSVHSANVHVGTFTIKKNN